MRYDLLFAVAVIVFLANWDKWSKQASMTSQWPINRLFNNEVIAIRGII